VADGVILRKKMKKEGTLLGGGNPELATDGSWKLGWKWMQEG